MSFSKEAQERNTKDSENGGITEKVQQQPQKHRSSLQALKNYLVKSIFYLIVVLEDRNACDIKKFVNALLDLGMAQLWQLCDVQNISLVCIDHPNLKRFCIFRRSVPFEEFSWFQL